MDNLAYVSTEPNNDRPFTISSGGSPDLKPHHLQVAIKSRFKPSKTSIYYKRTAIGLALLVLLLLIGLITVVILHINSRQSSQLICTSKECIRSAANLKYSMNLSANPCDNFYDFCCGKWSQEHPNHGWYSSFSTFTTITEKIVIKAMEVLSEDLKTDEPVAVGQAKLLFQSCLSTESADALGLQPLYHYLSSIDLPIVPTFFDSRDDKFDWMRSEVLLKTVLAMDVFIGFTVQPNIFKRDQNVIYVGLLFQSCPLPSPFKTTGKVKTHQDSDEEKSEEKFLRATIRTNIIKFVTKVILEEHNHVVQDSKLQTAAEIINNMTFYMDDLTDNYTLSDGASDEDDTIQLSVDELQKLTDNNVEASLPNFWSDYLCAIFDNTNVTLDLNTDKIYTTKTDLEYLWKVLDYVTSNDIKEVELYMWWSAVYAMIGSTTTEITSYIYKQASTYYMETNGDDTEFSRSRSLDCCELVNRYMGWAVSYALSDRTFANITKPKVDKMISDIKNAFIQHVRGITWMDKATRQVTLEKAAEMLSFVGYPDWLFKDGALDRKYQGLEINETTYLDNMMNIIAQYTNETLTSLRLINPRDWTTEPITVNAFNSFSDNAINVPMAILNYPLYDLGLEVMNYGSIGSILGHELTHGFDNFGRKHDKFGNYVQWWSNQTIATFENLTRCFVDQYDNYTIKGVTGHVKGNLTLGENLADNGGLNQAFSAYQRYKRRFGEEPKLPGFEDFTSDQMFFIAYGSIWCETALLSDLETQLDSDEHCPNSIRVVGTLQNSDDFSRVFNCPKNSFMNPKRQKCKIW